MANWGRMLASGLGMALETENTEYAEKLKENRVVAKARYAKQTAADEADFAKQTAYHKSLEPHLGAMDKDGNYPNKNNEALSRRILTKQAIEMGVTTGLYDTVTSMMKEQEGKDLDLSFLKTAPKKKVYTADGWKNYMATTKAGPLASALNSGVRSGVDSLFGSDSKEPDAVVATNQGVVQEGGIPGNVGSAKPTKLTEPLEFTSTTTTLTKKGEDGSWKDVQGTLSKNGHWYYTNDTGDRVKANNWLDKDKLNKPQTFPAAVPVKDIAGDSTYSGVWDDRKARYFTADAQGEKTYLEDVVPYEIKADDILKPGISPTFQSRRQGILQVARLNGRLTSILRADPTAGATVSNALIKGGSTIVHEIKAVASLIDRSSVNPELKKSRDSLMGITEDEMIGLGIDKGLANDAMFRQAAVQYTYAFLAMEGQTGKAASVAEFTNVMQATFSAGANAKAQIMVLESQNSFIKQRAVDLYALQDQTRAEATNAAYPEDKFMVMLDGAFGIPEVVEEVVEEKPPVNLGPVYERFDAIYNMLPARRVIEEEALRKHKNPKLYEMYSDRVRVLKLEGAK
jgi:hypothetical protein